MKQGDKKIMGLDNGIIVHYTAETPAIIKQRIMQMSYWQHDNITSDSCDICYWRKCWNIRSAIYSVIDITPGDGGSFLLNAANLLDIADVMKQEYADWDEETDSIWDIGEIGFTLGQSYAVLVYVASLMDEHPEYFDKVEFYDSY